MKKCASEKVKKFFKEINDGVLYGSQAKLARDLEVDSGLTNKYFSGVVKPSEKHIKKMAEEYKRTEEYLKNVFDIEEKISFHQSARQINSYHGKGHKIFNHGDAELIRAEIKVLELKIDLLLERSRRVARVPKNS